MRCNADTHTKSLSVENITVFFEVLTRFIQLAVIPGDYTVQLTSLLRYPTPVLPLDSTNTVHHTSLLIRQALALQLAPTPSTGVSVVAENRNLLDIPMEVPEPPSTSRRKGPQSTATRNRSSPTHARQQSSQPPGGLPEMLGGLFERGESLNINKTLMSAVIELKVSRSVRWTFQCLF